MGSLDMEAESPQPLGWYQLRDTLRLLASPAAVQLRAYPEFVPTAGEMPEEFDDFFRLVRDHARDRLSQEQWDALAAIDAAFDRMLEKDDRDLFFEAALEGRREWDDIRGLAAAALVTFQWDLVPREGEATIDQLSVVPEP